ncbi:hypothetical protein CIB84_017456 [Bambusicola thoracicus]|uniref:Uncharacterized protein n=1 Tax=Bambusicola thoracicus TaxID=9083 RepID=A0A2P4S3T6_BAMTH|nr:hypothetical protein CIB84_017456 [Bambusicola thoracicus]
MSVHKVSDPGTGKRVFIQYVPHTGPEVRSSPSPKSHGTPSQNLVSEQANENEENE